MPGRVRGITGHRTEWLTTGWELAGCAPGALQDPAALDSTPLDWTSASVPCTVASALRAAGRWSLDGPVRQFDAEDWWFRTTFTTSKVVPGEEAWLRLDGLATIADVWLNGTALLHSESMHVGHAVRVDRMLRDHNSLVIRFHSLNAALAARRPRPRWRTPMVAHQQLRWFRTTLLGRTPGWSPPAAAVGPWRRVAIEYRSGAIIEDVELDAAGDGRLSAALRLVPLAGDEAREVTLIASRGAETHRLPLTRSTDGSWRGEARFAGITPWWPHTHGEPALYDLRLDAALAGGRVDADLGRTGFRTITVDRDGGDFRIRVNGVAIFCRGACWTPVDPVALDAPRDALDRALDQVVECGMNMIRLGGTMVYESDAFLDGCDARGILLWQDLMFANMDYPVTPEFTEIALTEVRQVVDALQGRPAVAVLCGNSEGEQQAAMWGAPRELWLHSLFHERIPAVASRHLPSVPYWPSSTHGGDFPHQGCAGTASYYGVGAYLRPLEDARRAEVRFATECLAFANVPLPSSLARVPGGLAVRSHHAAWRERAPRDLGAGWDFDDVRDHYLRLRCGLDPMALRYADHDRYVDLSRAVAGEVMAATFLEWRRGRSATRGGLIWFLRDLWHGAGWGIVDAAGAPKANWHCLRRALAPRAIGISDEGGNGLAVHVINDGAVPLRGSVELRLLRGGEILVGRGIERIELAPRSTIERNAVAFFEGFRDLGHSYRFGPPSQDVVVASLLDEQGQLVNRAVHFIGLMPSTREHDIGLAAKVLVGASGTWRLEISTRRFAQSVHLDLDGYEGSDEWFHLCPGEARTIALRPSTDAVGPPAGAVRALNAELVAKVRAP